MGRTDSMVVPWYFTRETGESCLVTTTGVTTYISEIELRRMLIDPGSSLNIMPLSMHEVFGIPRDKVIE